jgi:hypothetical protein
MMCYLQSFYRALCSLQDCGIMPCMKANVLKATKSAARKEKKEVSSETSVMRRKVKQTFADQVEAFIKRYRPALEILAKR